jgi:hypothetical protein
MIPAPPKSPDFRVLPLGVILVAACLLGLTLGSGISILANFAEPRPVIIAALLAGSAWIATAILAVSLLGIFTAGRAERLAMGVLGVSFGRMLSAVCTALVIYLIAQPEGKSFWTCVLAAGFACLIAETAWAMRTVNQAFATRAARENNSIPNTPGTTISPAPSPTPTNSITPDSKSFAALRTDAASLRAGPAAAALSAGLPR